MTLAEVLIVIGIIGIVAEMTIPTVMKNTQHMEYVTALKKAYTNIQQVFKLYMSDQGVSDIGGTPLFDGISFNDTNVQNEVDAMVHKYFKVTKACLAGSDTSCQNIERYLKSPTRAAAFGTTWYSFYTVDGMELEIMLTASCTPNYTIIGPIKADCGSIMIDVNGAKGPNVWGRDFQGMYKINYDGTLYPIMSKQYADYRNDASQYWKVQTITCGNPDDPNIPNGTTGGGCIARIMENGWVMDY